MQSQKVFVCSLLVDILAKRGVDYELNGPTPISEVLTSDDKRRARETTCEGFINGEIQMTPQAQAKYLSNYSELKKYVHGLVNNWIKKNPEFNSGSKYTPSNPGTRTGQGDEQVREMRKLLKVTSDPESRKLIQAAIESRLEEIKPTIEINASAIPEHLRHLV